MQTCDSTLIAILPALSRPSSLFYDFENWWCTQVVTMQVTQVPAIVQQTTDQSLPSYLLSPTAWVCCGDVAAHHNYVFAVAEQTNQRTQSKYKSRQVLTKKTNSIYILRLWIEGGGGCTWQKTSPITSWGFESREVWVYFGRRLTLLHLEALNRGRWWVYFGTISEFDRNAYGWRSIQWNALSNHMVHVKVYSEMLLANTWHMS